MDAPRRWPWFVKAPLSGLALVLLVGAVEVFFYLTPKGRGGPRVEANWTDLSQEHEVLGRRARPGAEVAAWKKKGGETLFEVTYTTDEHGRRVTPGVAPGADRHLLFLGDSFAFGFGVEDNETLPAQVAALAPQHAPYNYGFPGYGPQHALVLLSGGEVREQVPEDAGLAIYIYIHAHVRRAIGESRIVRWAPYHPCYEIEDGELVYRGSFATGRPLRTRLYRLLDRSRTLRRFDITFPRLGDEHYALTARILEGARDAYRAAFDGDFVVLIWPGVDASERLIPHLERAGVRYLDYSGLTDSELLEHIPGDGHPTPGVYAAVARRLVADLELGAPD